ncbi:hypothetical protein Tco_0198086 [Tanacetum coccineum]
MANFPLPNNDPNIPEDEHAPAPEHAPIAPNPAHVQPNDYLADDEEEEPISEQAPTAPVVPIVHNDPRDPYVAARDAAPVPATDDDNTAAAKDSQPSESRGSLRDP